MSRRWDVFPLLPLASRAAAGVATGFRVGEYESGQLHLYAPILAAGAWVRAWWQSSVDGERWGDWLASPTLAATGVKVIGTSNVGYYARVRWTQSGPAVAFGVTFVMKE